MATSTSTAPYWGNLDPPKVNRTTSMKRKTGKESYYGEEEPRRNKQSMAAQPEQYANQQNRASIQSQAQTASTTSPFASPTASTFRGDGLAPRPSSFQYGTSGAYGSKDYEKRRRRASRDPEVFSNDTESYTPPPAAPEPPRSGGPPVSYKAFNTNGGTAVNQNPGNPPPKGRPDIAVDTALDQQDVSATRERRKPADAYSALSNTGERKPASRNDKNAVRTGSVRARKEQPEVVDPGSQERARKSSVAESESAARRREWAPDRSPLQRLELTLDSITKEEKRARIKEAELHVTERPTQGDERKNSVRFRNRPVAKAVEKDPELLPAGTVDGRRSERSRTTTDTSSRGPATEQFARDSAQPRNRGGREVRPAERQVEKNSISERGPSFRDRTQVPVADAATAGVAMGPGVSRSTSNKLKKQPPGDPWYHERLEAERGASARSMEDSRPPVPPKDLASASSGPQSRQPVYSAIVTGDGASDDDYEEPQVRRGGSKKLHQLTGEQNFPQNPDPIKSKILPVQQQLYADKLDRSEELGPAAVLNENQRIEKPVHGHRFVVAPAVANLSEDKAPVGRDGHHHFKDILHDSRRSQYRPGDGMYTPGRRLDEWKKARVASLVGGLLELGTDESATVKTEADKDKTWWEAGNKRKRRPSTSNRKAEMYDGPAEDPKGTTFSSHSVDAFTRLTDSIASTAFRPPLYLKCGPLLRYCGMREEEPPPSRPGAQPRSTKEIWRGTVMIVTSDKDSSYDITPTLRLFVQPMNLLPPPPVNVDGALEPEYIDPLAGLPKIARDGSTLYVRPVEELEEEKDKSTDETDDGLFEKTRTLPGQYDGADSKARNDPRDEFGPDGEKVNKHAEVQGFRLHVEHGVTFWRFNIEVELGPKAQRIAYRINRGPATGFWVPARGESMNIMFHSCNGFSLSVNPDQFSGPDPMWRDVLNTHQTQPFHVMIGGGDQIYNDRVMKDTTVFQEWLAIKNPLHKHNAPFTQQMQQELELFYLNRYSMWFSQGLFGLANSQIPMVNIYDDHDIIDGYGSYPHHFMDSPVFTGLGAIAFKYYMLFQHQSSIDEGEDSEPSWLIGNQPGPYIKEMSRSVFMSMGQGISFLGLDCRTERSREEIISLETMDRIFDRCSDEIVKGKTKHLIVLLGVPIAYPRLVWLENILTSRLMEPVKAMGKAGLFGNFLNKFDGGVEILDDLDDHWTAKNHKKERLHLIQDFQDLAAEKSVRVTILGGDVHLAAIGQFFSNPKLGIPKDKDHRYMPNVISSAIVNTPPPEMMADVLNKRNKVHHLDHDTDEDMIPIFTSDVNGSKRNNKHLLPRRNWCSIREYNPEMSPPPTPTEERSPSPPRGGLLRRLSGTRGPSYRAEAAGRPPVREGLFRRLSSTRRRGSINDTDNTYNSYESPSRRRSMDDHSRPPVSQFNRTQSQKPRRSLSLTRAFKPGGLFNRSSGKRRSNAGGINGYGDDSDSFTESESGGDDDFVYNQQPMDASHRQHTHTPRMRGGAGDPSYFPDAEDYVQPPSRTRSKLSKGKEPMYTNQIQSRNGRDEETYSPRPTQNRPPVLRNRNQDDYTEAPTVPPGNPRTSRENHTGVHGSSRHVSADVRNDNGQDEPPQARRPFHRTATGMSIGEKKYKNKASAHEINLEGGLEITLNVEVNQKDPVGITVPYRLLVPALWYEETQIGLGSGSVSGAGAAYAGGAHGHGVPGRKPSGLKRWVSFGKKNVGNKPGYSNGSYNGEREPVSRGGSERGSFSEGDDLGQMRQRTEDPVDMRKHGKGFLAGRL